MRTVFVGVLCCGAGGALLGVMLAPTTSLIRFIAFSLAIVLVCMGQELLCRSRTP